MTRTFDTRSFVAICLAALAVGAVYVYPDIRFIQHAGSAYRGIAPIGFRDETLYLARMNAVARGDAAAAGNPVIFEHRSDPVIMPALSETLEQRIGRFFGLSTAQTDIAATFILPALLFVLIAFFVLGLTGSLWGGVAAAFAVLFGTHLFSRAFLLGGRILSGEYTLPLWFTRPITPQTHFVLFLSALLCVRKALSGGRLVPAIAGAVFLGSLFYASVFYWVYVYTVLGIIFALSLLEGDRVSCRLIGIMTLLSAAISVPYWIGNARTIADPNFPLLLLRYNIAFTHRAIVPAGALVMCAILVASAKFLAGQAGKAAFRMLFAMSAAVIVTLNQQVLTGKLFKESHWTTYTGKFALIVVGLSVLAIAARVLVERRRAALPAVRIAMGAFVTLLTVHAIGMQENHCRAHLAENVSAQEMASLLAWLDANAAGRVVLPSPNEVALSELIPIYTGSYVYYSEPFFCLSLIPAEETRHRMIASYRLFGYSADEALAHPYAWDGALFLTSDTNRGPGFAEAEREKFRAAYEAASGTEALRFARRFRVDDIVAVNATDGEAVRKLTASGGRLVYTDPKYSVIRVGG